MNSVRTGMSRFEFIALIASLSALDAMAIDMMLPALDQMSLELGFQHANDRHYIITSLFFGVAFGLLVSGFLGDRFGRRPPIIGGILVYIVGSLICVFSWDLSSILIGRVVQGIGAAAPYVLAVAIVRDSFKGPEMASIMSFVLMIFMAVPAVAPLMGQLVLLVFEWRAIFVVLALAGLACLIWFVLRQPETLPVSDRASLDLKQISRSIQIVVKDAQVRFYTLAYGAMFGAFLVYLSTVQQIMQEQYQVGRWFTVYFAFLAAILALSSFVNSRLVVRFGMLSLILRALSALAGVALIFLLFEWQLESGMPFWAFMLCMSLIYLCCGMIFGNFMSLAMENMGAVAGVASALIGFVSTILASILGGIISSFYTDTLIPILTGFTLLATFSAVLTLLGSRSSTIKPAQMKV